MDKAIDNLEKVLQLTPPEPSDGAAPSRERGDNVSMNPLIEVLVGKRPPSPPVPLQDLQFMDPSLNPSQQEAVRFALEAPEIALIHGPPGVRPPGRKIRGWANHFIYPRPARLGTETVTTFLNVMLMKLPL